MSVDSAGMMKVSTGIEINGNARLHFKNGLQTIGLKQNDTVATTLETVNTNLFSTSNISTSSYADLNATLADIYTKLSALYATPIGTIIANVSTATSLTVGN